MSGVGNELKTRVHVRWETQFRAARLVSGCASLDLGGRHCDSLDDAAAADFVGDGLEARAPLRRVRVVVGDPASLLELDGIGRVGHGGMALMLKTDSSGAVVARGTLRSAPN